MVPQSAANKYKLSCVHNTCIKVGDMWPFSGPFVLCLGIHSHINISPLILHGQERLPGYVHLFIVPTKSAATMNFYKKRSTTSDDLCHGTRKLISLLSPSWSTTTDNLNTENVNTDNDPNLKKFWIPLPYIGKHGTRLTNSFIRKITPLLKSQCKIIINWQATDAGSFVSLKDPTPKQYKSSIV